MNNEDKIKLLEEENAKLKKQLEYFVFHLFHYQRRTGESKTIVGEIPIIDFTFFLIFLSSKMGV